jgi:hypothetical protein
VQSRLKDLARDIEPKLDDHGVGKLLTTIDGVGPLTAPCLIAELGDLARLSSVSAIASYVGVAPRLRQSGKKRFFSGSPTIPFGQLACARRSGCWFSPPCDAIRGCGIITNAFAPRANLARWPS